jgi:hypothetical protein
MYRLILTLRGQVRHREHLDPTPVGQDRMMAVTSTGRSITFNRYTGEIINTDPPLPERQSGYRFRVEVPELPITNINTAPVFRQEQLP